MSARILLLSTRRGPIEEDLMSEAVRSGHEILFRRPEEIQLDLQSARPPVLLNVDLDSIDVCLVRRTRYHHEAAAAIASIICNWGIPVVDGVDSIVLPFSKAMELCRLAPHVNIPKTAVLWGHGDMCADVYKWEYPVVVKPTDGWSGAGLRVFERPEALAAFVQEMHDSFADCNYLIQQFVAGIELRCTVVGDDAWVSRQVQVPSTPHSSTHTVTHIPWTDPAAAAVARHAARICQHTIAGTDLICTPQGDIYVLECNRNPGIPDYLLDTHVFARAVVSHLDQIGTRRGLQLVDRST